MSELSGDGEAGVPPETPSGGTDATSGSRFAGYSDAEVDAALAAEDPGEDPAPEPPPGPGEQAGREEDPGQRDEDPGQRADAGPWEGAALPGGDETGPGESAGEDDNGDGSAQDEACPAADADGPEYSGDPDGEYDGGEYDGGVADLLAEEEPATDAGELPPGSPQAGHADAPPAPEARPDDDGATPSAGPDGVSVRQPGDSTEPAVQAAAGDSRHDGQDGAHDPPEKGRPGYPDIPGRYPENYKPAPDDAPLPAVDGPHQPPEKWIDAINPNKAADEGRIFNCGDCARSVDGTWHGHPAVAAAIDFPRVKGEYSSCMTEWAGVPLEPASMADIKERLTELGSGSSAVVGCDWKTGAGHWFNAVNDNGTVKAVDGQSRKVAAWPPTFEVFRYDESLMRRSDAIFFTSDGKAVRNDHK